MRPHIHVQRKLAKLRDEHGLTDDQLFAVHHYVVAEVLGRPSLNIPSRDSYDTWYKPRS